MHRYCTEVLHFSEATAFTGIGAARATRSYPHLLERIREGALHLAGANLLAPRLTPENHVELLDLARHKSKRAIEELLADRAPSRMCLGRSGSYPSQVDLCGPDALGDRGVFARGDDFARRSPRLRCGAHRVRSPSPARRQAVQDPVHW